MSNLKRYFTNLISNNFLFARFVALLEAFDNHNHEILRILTYHRIDTPHNRSYLYPGLSISPVSFAAQMEYLSASGYQTISAQDLINRLTTPNPKPLSPNSVLISFDDGYQDFQEFAWPVLKRLHIPAILFIPTAYPGHPELPFWWDTLHYILTSTKKHSLPTPIGDFSLSTPQHQSSAYTRLRAFLTTLPNTEALQTIDNFAVGLEVPPAQNAILSWEDLRKLAADGLAVGAHTQTHPRLDRISPQESEREITRSLQDLSDNLGMPASGSGGMLPIFAYPGGGVTHQAVSILERAGIKAAFTANRGINDIKHVHPLRLNRINVGQGTNLPLLRAQLLYRPARIMSNLFHA